MAPLEEQLLRNSAAVQAKTTAEFFRFILYFYENSPEVLL